MPQVLKEEIRQQIFKAALDEFYARGFKAATMKDIALKADIPTGLIYSYYKNKKDLFKQIVLPVINLFKKSVLKNEYDRPEDQLYKHELPTILNCIANHSKEMVILIDKSQGSSFETVKDDIINEITEHLKETPLLKNTSYDEIFYHILSTNFTEGVFELARHYQGREWAKEMLDLLIHQHLYGISGLGIFKNK